MTIDPAAPQHQLNTLVDGYKLTSILGQGSFAVVFKGETKTHEYAVKCLYKTGLSKSQLQLQMEESTLLSCLDHPNIIRLVKTIETSECVYLFMEYCDSDLFDAIMSSGGFSESKTKRLFQQLCGAVQACHDQGIYHRDLKPENVLLQAAQVKLADFGLATKHSLSSEFGCGSIRYMAPECLSGKKGASLPLPYSCAANDVWSLGIILINMLTGKNPWVEPSRKDKHYNAHMFGKKSLKDSFAVQFGFSQELCTLLRRVFSLDPFARPSARDFAQVVSEIELLEHEESDASAISREPSVESVASQQSDLIFKFERSSLQHDSKSKHSKRSKHVRGHFLDPMPSPPQESFIKQSAANKKNVLRAPIIPTTYPPSPSSMLTGMMSGLSSVFFDGEKLL